VWCPAGRHPATARTARPCCCCTAGTGRTARRLRPRRVSRGRRSGRSTSVRRVASPDTSRRRPRAKPGRQLPGACAPRWCALSWWVVVLVAVRPRVGSRGSGTRCGWWPGSAGWWGSRGRGGRVWSRGLLRSGARGQVSAAPHVRAFVGFVGGGSAQQKHGTRPALLDCPQPVGAVFADPAVAASASAGYGSAGVGGVGEGAGQGFPEAYGVSSRLVRARWSGHGAAVLGHWGHVASGARASRRVTGGVAGPLPRPSATPWTRCS
jgi:hypothetical protein